MNKMIAGALFTMILLVGCGQVQYSKVDGEVIGKRIGGRYNTSYYIRVSYPIDSDKKKFAIKDIYVKKDEFDEYNKKDKVIVYVSKDGIGEILK